MVWIAKSLKVVRLGRVHFLFPGLLLFCFGAFMAGLAGAQVSWQRLVWGYLAFLPAHLSVSYSNDYHDADADRLGSPTLFTGGSGVLVRHPELMPLARNLALALIACSLVLSVTFMRAHALTPWYLALVVAGNLLGWFYAAPPLRLAYRGLGEAATTLTIGAMIPALGYLSMSGRLDAAFLPVMLPLMAFGLAFITSVESPDMEADLRAGKHTLVARRGRRCAFRLVGAMAALATLALAALAVVQPSLLAERPMLAVFSLLTAGVGLWGALRAPVARAAATHQVNRFLVALILFMVLADAYLLRVVMG
ncbi:MAG: prenyltransferase [Anaerolineae bacterium]